MSDNYDYSSIYCTGKFNKQTNSWTMNAFEEMMEELNSLKNTPEKEFVQIVQGSNSFTIILRTRTDSAQTHTK